MVVQAKMVEFHQIARQFLSISKAANCIYQDQLQLLGNISESKVFEVDVNTHSLYFLNQHFSMQFKKKNDVFILDFKTDLESQAILKIKDFLFTKIYFYTSDLGVSNSIDLREKAHQLRALIFNSLFEWVNGTERLQQVLMGLSVLQAEILDNLLIKSGYCKKKYFIAFVRDGAAIPADILNLFNKICTLDVLHDDSFYSVQSLMQQIDDLSIHLCNVMPAPLSRLCQIFFSHTFNLLELENRKNDINVLWRHADESPHFLGFIKFIDKDHWKNPELFAKYQFLGQRSKIWSNEIIQAPVFDHKRVVNWLFRQDQQVLDWLSQYIEHHSVRLSVIGLSFIDCSQYHPNIILSALQYFQYSSARILIYSCAYSAEVAQWLKLQPKKEQKKFNLSEPSVLYLDEWLQLIQAYSSDDIQKLKRIYLNLSRTMQAYMQHLQQQTKQIPLDLVDYLQPEKQQSRSFHFTLQRHGIKPDEFREHFYLRERNIRESVFESYVRDFLLDYLSQNIKLAKNITWLGLFYKAVRWHHQIQKDEILLKLKKKYSSITWQPFTSGQHHFLNWHFDELRDIEMIIEESQIFHHCLATSYTEQIMSKSYVAFHMWSISLDIHLTLGCHIRQGTLKFDQLEHPNNQKAEQLFVDIARQFIDHLNKNNI